MGILKALLRAYSYIFGILLSLFLLGISIVSLSSGSPLDLPFLPWNGQTLAYWILAWALAGLLFVLLAMGGRLRALYFLWSLAVLVLLFRGFFLTSYKFLGPVKFKPAVWLTLAVLVATVGAWSWPQKPRPVRRPQFY